MDLYSVGVGLAWVLLGLGGGFALRAALTRRPAAARQGWALAFVAGLMTLAVTSLHYRGGHGPASVAPMDGEVFAREHPMVMVLLAAVLLAMLLARWAERRSAGAPPADDPPADS